jgi:iron complex transport system ATP-binding protein
MTVWDIVSLGRYPHNNWLGQLTEHDKNLVTDAIHKVKLDDKTHAYIHCLSDGERLRAMIARALAQDTPLILMDEPTAHLDLPNRVDTMLLLRELAHSTHKTILLSTHELDLALQTADQIWLMMPQEGIITGIPEDLVLEGAFQKAFQADSFIFNPANGNFSVSYETSKPLHIYGDRTRTYWTVRALARMGYSGVEEAENCVEIVSDGWILNHKEHCKSIAELAKSLESIFQ